MVMNFYHCDEAGALNMEISSFRRRVTDALRLGSFHAGGGLEIIDKELKNRLEYEEMKRIWTEEKH